MAGSNSSCSPSSSAVTIPIAGKSILKRPTQVHSSLFSRITRFLPTQSPTTPSDDSKPLKRAHFILPEIAIVYPISSVNPPSTPALKEEKKAIEDREFERRRRVVRGNASGSGFHDADDWWSLDKVESFYRECCVQCDEQPDLGITTAFKNASPSNPRSVDFSGVQLTFASSSILSDVFTIEWGLRKLVFRECNLDEHILKPMLHSLLIPESLSFLSLASNRKLKTSAFRLVGAYVAQAKNLQFLDLSQNNLDKKSVEYIVAALATAPNQGLVSLRIDDCQLRPAALEALSRAVRTSSLRNISLRHNRINAAGAVALALMIRDYPDVVPASLGTPTSSAPSSPSSSQISLPTSPTSPSSPQTAPARTGSILPPPRHPTQTVQTTYTPYVPRARRGAPPRTPILANNPPLSETGQPVPIITSSSQGGVTTRHLNLPHSAAPGASFESPSRRDAGPSAALLDKVRALDALPRLGALRTLDLKGNDLRMGITYLAQVLKRNRTLKVLNLSENKLDVMCLATIAEALKYNSCLETLDLSKNPCSGPGLEGIQSLRTAFTLNNALKRLFLSSTSLTSAGAIALAEFLPESTSLLHLDLTLNNLDIAAVMALSSGLKANHVMRCLDLNIPPGDEVFAKMCREILNSCVRNTEEAERNSQAAVSGRGLGKGVWGMIEESELAKSISIRLGEKDLEVDIAVRARECLDKLTEALQPSSTPTKAKPPFSALTSQPNVIAELSKDARTIVAELATVIQNTQDAALMQELLNVNDQLNALLRDLPAPARPVLTLHGLGIQYNSLDPDSKNGNGGGMQNGHVLVNGDAHVHGPESEPEETTPTTPRADKGKGRAEPEPEEHEKVLSPTSVLAASAVERNSEDEDEEDEDGLVVYTPEAGTVSASPNDRSRSWVAEEGEVFRKGTVLLGPEEMEGEYAGEELRKELLEAMVERPPPRPLHDQDEYPDMPVPSDRNEEPATPTSPVETKPPPRVYVSRRSSTNSILSMISPTMPASAPPGTTEFSLRDSPGSFSSPKSLQVPSSGPSSPAVSIGPSLSSIVGRSPSISGEESH
ncbi:Leucine-rich repeat-containing protein 68 [Termitomyces sp. T112]|nr:Leucine-rich repeat-containing protein 68 [Termitomyces sp. T112]